MEGLLCSMIDRADTYEVVYIGNKTWYVFTKSILQRHEDCLKNRHRKKCTKYGPIPYFDHIQKVCIDSSNFMSCTCGNVHDMMAPCVHCIAVLLGANFTNIENVTPELYPLRYWMTYNYYFRTKFGKDLAPRISNTLELEHKAFRKNSFNEKQQFRGVDLKNNPFLDKLPANIDSSSQSRLIANAILECIEKKVFV